MRGPLCFEVIPAEHASSVSQPKVTLARQMTAEVMNVTSPSRDDMCLFSLAPYEDCSLSFCIVMSSSSDAGTLTKAGTVTAFNLRKACTGSSVTSVRAASAGCEKRSAPSPGKATTSWRGQRPTSPKGRRY